MNPPPVESIISSDADNSEVPRCENSRLGVAKLLSQSTHDVCFNEKLMRRNQFARQWLNERQAVTKRAMADMARQQAASTTRQNVEKSQAGGANTVKKHSKKTETAKELKSQSLVDTLKRVQNKLAERAVRDAVGHGIDFMEDLGIMCTGIADARSNKGIAAAVLAFIKKTCLDGESILATIHGYVGKYCDINLLDRTIELMSQSDVEAGNGALPSIISGIRGFAENWSRVKEHPAFIKISTLLSLAVAVGMCKLSNVAFNIGSMEIMRIPAYNGHCAALDFTAAIFDTIAYFIETGYKCFKERSLRPFIFSDTKAEEMDKNYYRLKCLWPNVKPGNLEALGSSEAEFDFVLSRTIEDYHTLIRNAANNFDKAMLSRRYAELRGIESEFKVLKSSARLRETAFGIYLLGDTAVGKSTLCSLLIKAVLAANGKPYTDDYIASISALDKFQSNWRSCTQGAIVDDIGNDMNNGNGNPPTRIILDLINNQPAYAQAADVESKGKVCMAPTCVVATSNVEVLEVAQKYSRCPGSIVRRFPLIIKVRVKPEYAKADNTLNSELVFDRVGPDEVPDIWLMDVYEPDITGRNMEKLLFSDVDIHQVLDLVINKSRGHFKMQKRLLEKHQDQLEYTLCDVCSHPRMCCKCIKAQKEREARIHDIPKPEPDNTKKRRVDGMVQESGTTNEEAATQDRSSIYANMHISRMIAAINTGELGDVSLFVGDPEPPIILSRSPEDPHNTDETFMLSQLALADDDPQRILDMGVNLGETFDTQDISDAALGGRMIREPIERIISSSLCEILSAIRFLLKPLEQWVNPDATTLMGAVMIGATQRHYIFGTIDNTVTTTLKASLACLVTGCVFSPFALLGIPLVLAGGLGRVLALQAELMGTVSITRTHLIGIMKKARESNVAVALGACIAFGGAYKFIQSLRASGRIRESKPTPQGNIAPSTSDELDERAAEKNMWCPIQVTKIPRSQPSATSSPDEFKENILKNTVHCEFFDVDDKKQIIKTGVRSSDGLFLKSNYILVPAHSTTSRHMYVICRLNGELSGSSFGSHVDLDHSFLLPGTDMRVFHVPNAPSMGDILKYVSLTIREDCPYSMLLYKDKNGIVTENKVQPTYVAAKTVKGPDGPLSYPGYEYESEYPTFSGLCGSPLITATKAARAIIGIHLAGDGVTGLTGILVRDELDKAIANIAERIPTRTAHAAGVMSTHVAGKEVRVESEINTKSPSQFLDEGSTVINFGSTAHPRNNHKSMVMPTSICEDVAKVFGTESKWGPPDMRGWRPWQKTLSKMSHPSMGVPPEHLEWAYTDYLNALKAKLLGDAFSKRRALTKPLTEVQTVNGVPGLPYASRMNMSTSVGYPFTGPKSAYTTPLDPSDHPPYACPVQLDARFWNEWYRMEESYKKGERNYPIFGAALKDESLPINSGKCRVFQMAPISLQLGMRKYFLPISSFLSSFPLDSECAVGLNCHGPEWHDMSEHIKKYGADRILAGDYSKYDATLSHQIMFAAFSIMIDLAEATGNYTEEDLYIMQGIATDICCPVTNFNGDLLMLLGTNPSGQNMTAYTNSLANSLLFRCAFYGICKDRILREEITFKDVCALMTYGDDAKSSVKEGWDAFNHVSVAAYLCSMGMTFTMPDKKSVATFYMKDTEAEFLKRTNVWNEDLGKWMAALNDDSIMKSLMSCVKSNTLEPVEQSLANMRGAMVEWFFHGKEVYEKRRSQLTAVAQMQGIVGWCKHLNLTYEDRLEMWRENYLKPTSSGGETEAFEEDAIVSEEDTEL